MDPDIRDILVGLVVWSIVMVGIGILFRNTFLCPIFFENKCILHRNQETD